MSDVKTLIVVIYYARSFNEQFIYLVDRTFDYA